MDRQDALDAAAFAGEILLTNGAEISRVEDTVLRLLNVFGVGDANVYVVSNALFITISPKGEQSITVVRSLPLGKIHLGRIDAVNALARQLVTTKQIDKEEVMAHLQQCATLPHSNRYAQLFVCGLASAAFCYLFGGSLQDSLCALIIGFLLQVFRLFQDKFSNSIFVTSILSSFFVTSLAVFAVHFGLGFSLSHIIIGAIFSLVPGIALTTAIRNFFSGHYLSGYIHLINALLMAVCLAVGVTVALWLWGLLLPEVIYI